MKEPSEYYYIKFDTRINPGKIEAIRVKLDVITVKDPKFEFRIDLCDHPLYAELCRYVKDNPR